MEQIVNINFYCHSQLDWESRKINNSKFAINGIPKSNNKIKKNLYLIPIHLGKSDKYYL